MRTRAERCDGERRSNANLLLTDCFEIVVDNQGLDMNQASVEYQYGILSRRSDVLQDNGSGRHEPQRFAHSTDLYLATRAIWLSLARP